MAGFISSSLRPGSPIFLDLPWALPVGQSARQCVYLEPLPIGLTRHPVVFIHYQEALYALKELPPGLAEKEYQLLRQMKEQHLPTVDPVGHVQVMTDQGEASILITRYLEYSMPYQALFASPDRDRHRDLLLDAMASLLVQLHLAGIYWGDCSLSNTLFRRDAGTLQAYLVDAETSEIHPTLSDSLRSYELDVMEENVCGALADLMASGLLPARYPIIETGAYIRERYERLWAEINREELLDAQQPYRVQERIRALNQLGFSVDEVVLQRTPDGDKLRMRAIVTDRHFHRELLHSLTGVDAEDRQAEQIMNEIQELRARLMRQQNRSLPVSVAAWRWLQELYQPSLERLKPWRPEDTHPTQLYCQMLEHKWFLSEKARQDVGHETSALDYIETVLKSVSGATDLDVIPIEGTP